MKKYLIYTASSIALAIASPAYASGGVDCGNASGQWMSQDEAKIKASELGYDVRRVKGEDGCFEIYALDQDGDRVELFMNPVTGVIVEIDNKS